ncbi:protein eyes shut [Leptidea sinapis]|uniref:protein eyes shut n=1 Tax=Leptidea sinapis TaxID=189913 RepID=UPI0021C34775|nr:protein eyes shut [Leptidea sinapis]
MCHCIFNYSGRFCEEKLIIKSAAFGANSFIIHRVRNDTTINIQFDAKTLISDGKIMHVDIAKGVYMELYLNMGLLKFEFSCGYQTMLLSEVKTFVNKGHPMRIETRLDFYLNEQHCNATLHLNDTVAMSGGQVANITTIDQNITLLFGDIGHSLADQTRYQAFVGCITGLLVNGERREVFNDALSAADITECSSLVCLSTPCSNGGTCRSHADGYVCACANGWMGVNCNQSVCENNPCQYGGSCVRNPGSGFLCLCPFGKHGIFCEYNVEITRPSLAPVSSGISSFIIFPLSSAAVNSDRFDLRLRFQSEDMDQIALLAFVGQNGHHDSKSQHLALTFVKGYVMVTWNMGGGSRRIFTSRPLSARRGGHTVRVWRRGRTAGLTIDGRHNVSGNAPANDNKMNILPYLYIGGHPSQDFHTLPHDLPLHSGWKGCIWEVGGQAIATGNSVGGRGVGQCGVAQCTVKSCNAPRGVCIHSPATYGCICNEGWFGATCSSKVSPCDYSETNCNGRCVITAGSPQCDCPYGKIGTNCDKDITPTDLMFPGVRSYVRLHPHSISSVSLSLEADIKPNKERGLVMYVETPHFYTALSLQGGLLEFRWTDRLSGLSSLVRSGVVVSLSQWHSVRAGRYRSRLYVWLDGALTTEPMLAHAYPHTASEASIILGGAADLSHLPFDVMSGPPESFAGCLKNFHVNNIQQSLDKANIAEGQNIGECERECSNGRCRRATCSPAHCAAPARCRRDRCVCGAGTAGDYCQHNITISVPQFDGDAMISLSRSIAGRNEDMTTLPKVPNYLALNFTTAEPNGLLIWIKMGVDYIGVGLENGYMRLVGSSHCSNGEARTKPKIMSQIIKSSFMADGEWHAIELRPVTNVTLVVDKITYTEETCSSLHDYVDVETYIGGITEHDDDTIRKIFPQNFRGCIDSLSTQEESYISNFTNIYSENVKICQQFLPERT